MSLILIILSIILNLINKYINLEPKCAVSLGSCIGTWNQLLGKKRKKKESRAGGSALSSNTPSGFWFDAWALALPHPSSVLSPCHLSVSSVVRSVGVEASSLGSALRRWVLPSVVGLHPPSLGSALRRWALPSTAGFYPSSLSSALRVASATSSSSSCCPPHPPHHALYALRLSFDSMAHLVDLCLVVWVHIVSGGFTLRCSTLRRVVSRNRLAVVELVGVLGMVAGPWHSRRGGGGGRW